MANRRVEDIGHCFCNVSQEISEDMSSGLLLATMFCIFIQRQKVNPKDMNQGVSVYNYVGYKSVRVCQGEK